MYSLFLKCDLKIVVLHCRSRLLFLISLNIFRKLLKQMKSINLIGISLELSHFKNIFMSLRHIKNQITISTKDIHILANDIFLSYLLIMIECCLLTIHVLTDYEIFFFLWSDNFYTWITTSYFQDQVKDKSITNRKEWNQFCITLKQDI